MTTSPQQGPGKRGYWFALFVVILAIALTVVQWAGMSRRLASMSRVKMPGTAQVKLPAGDTPFYTELVSQLDGAVVQYAAGKYECQAEDPAVALGRSSTSVTYSMGGYTGELAFVATTAKEVETSISCTGTELCWRGGRAWALASRQCWGRCLAAGSSRSSCSSSRGAVAGPGGERTRRGSRLVGACRGSSPLVAARRGSSLVASRRGPLNSRMRL